MPAPQQPQVAVSTVIFGLRDTGNGPVLSLPLVRRTRDPWQGRWALPGGWLPADETFRDVARRTLADTTGLHPRHLEQLYTFGAVDRSPGQRVVTVVYWALVRADEVAATKDDPNVAWFPAAAPPDLAFDHGEIVYWAVRRLKNKLGWTSLEHALLPDVFTLADLRAVHEAILGRELDPANFRHRVLAAGVVQPTGDHVPGGRHRPPALYRSTADQEFLT